MAKPRLKVFRAQMGFAEAVVAAPSQKAALEAWGARQNLFAEGLATVTEDAAAVTAALDRPGVVLQRPIGSKTAFTEQLVGRPDPPPARPKAAPQPPAKSAPPPKPKPDRSKLTAAEAALAAVDDDAKAALADLARRRKQLDEEEARLRARLDAQREAARRKVDEARRTFDSA